MLRVKPRTLPVYLRSKCPTSSSRYPAPPFRSAQQVQLFISYSHSNGCFVFSSCLLKSSPVLIPTGGVPVQYCEQPTNGLVYFRAMCSLNTMPEELRLYVPLFCSVITKWVNLSVCTTRTRIICEMLTLCMLLNLENHICKDWVVCLCLCNQDGLWSSGLQAAVPADGAEDGGHVRVHPGHPGLHPAGHVRAGQRQLTDNSLDYLQCYEHLKWNGSCAVCFRVSSWTPRAWTGTSRTCLSCGATYSTGASLNQLLIKVYCRLLSACGVKTSRSSS